MHAAINFSCHWLHASSRTDLTPLSLMEGFQLKYLYIKVLKQVSRGSRSNVTKIQSLLGPTNTGKGKGKGQILINAYF